MQEQLLLLARAMLQANHVIVFTGAGVSTESGIPDFRGRSGIWQDDDAVRLLSLDTLYGDPQLFYSRGIAFLETLRGKEPNPAHMAIARLEDMGVVRAVITQNIDGLHQAAGSKQVIEIHGNLRTCYCMGCKHTISFEGTKEQVAQGVVPPECPECGGLVRPSVVFFEDQMTEDFSRAMDQAQMADFALVVGSSLQVAPAAYLPAMVPSMGIVNLESTPYDGRAVAAIHDKAGVVLPRLVEAVEDLRR